MFILKVYKVMYDAIYYIYISMWIFLHISPRKIFKLISTKSSNLFRNYSWIFICFAISYKHCVYCITMALSFIWYMYIYHCTIFQVNIIILGHQSKLALKSKLWMQFQHTKTNVFLIKGILYSKKNRVNLIDIAI